MPTGHKAGAVSAARLLAFGHARTGQGGIFGSVTAHDVARGKGDNDLTTFDGFDEAERLPLDQMPPLERFILHRLWQLDGQVRQAYETYDFQDVIRPVLEFCSGDLSALYFDVRKDSLYCDRPDAIRRRAARTVMHEVFLRLTAWLAPWPGRSQVSTR